MTTLTFELPAQAEQTAFNLERWAEVLADRTLAKIEGRIETDRHGYIIMSPPPAFNHGRYQLEIGSLLRELLPEGIAITECPISTADGVKGADVAWISKVRLAEIGENICLTAAPEICVEVLSPDNSKREMSEKIALYFDAGAMEVWLCDRDGKLSFFTASEIVVEASQLCPAFPLEIIL